VAALLLSTVVVVAGRLATLTLALAVAVLAAGLAGIKPRQALVRLIPLNLFMFLVLLIVPLSTEGTPLVSLGSLQYSQEGLLLAGAVAIKGNAIVLAIMALVGTMDMVVLGHALHHLGVPEKLIHLMLFSVRYLDVLRREYLRLSTALKVRAFRPRMSRHTYRAYGYLVGMLLVRSLDRSERIVAAMKCRGFRGRFYLLDHFAYSRRDAWLAVVVALVAILLAWAELA
jgi:cobalt/nickel transport system permease protein